MTLSLSDRQIFRVLMIIGQPFVKSARSRTEFPICDLNKGPRPQNAIYIAMCKSREREKCYKYDCVRWQVRICREPTQMHTQTFRNFRSVIVFTSSNLITIGASVTKRNTIVNIRRWLANTIV